MDFKENLQMALFSIKTNKVRAILTMLGIIIGVASVISIITMGNGAKDYIVGMIEDMGGSSAINVMVNPSSASDSDYITGDDIKFLREIEHVQNIAPVVMGLGNFTLSNGTSGLFMPIGSTTDVFDILSLTPIHGRNFTEAEYLAAKNVCIIDSSSAIMLFGHSDVVGETVSYSANGTTVTFKIIGVMDIASIFGGDTSEMLDMMEQFTNTGMMFSSCMGLIPASTAIQIMGTSERYDNLYIMADDPAELDGIGAATLAKLQARHNNHDREVYSVVNLATFLELLDTVITVFTLFIAAVSGISLIVGGIGVMNIMFVSVTERTREIGIRKALGAKTKDIMIQFLTESILICLIGGLIGMLLGFVISGVVSAIMKISFKVKWYSILISVGFSSGIGIFFGMYPAKKAAEMNPIDALRKD